MAKTPTKTTKAPAKAVTPPVAKPPAKAKATAPKPKAVKPAAPSPAPVKVPKAPKPKPAAEAKSVLKQTSETISKLASDILADRIVPTIDQIKAIAASALGQDETGGKKKKKKKK